MFSGFTRIGFHKGLCRRARVTSETAVHLEGVHLERIGQISDFLRCLYAELNEETLVTFTGAAFISGERAFQIPEDL